MSDTTETFNLSDFASVSISVTFQNLTSHAEGLAEDSVKCVELEEDGPVLELPGNSCVAHHSVEIEVVRQGRPAAVQ